jgi:hypothetical protein
MLRSWHARAWRALAGEDGPGRPALPISELLAPLPLLMLALLALNDWALKPSSAPGWLTGKLSDVAGLALFPLIVTAVGDLVLLGASRAGLRVDATLRAGKLAAAIAVTAIGFTAVKLSPAIAHAVAAILAVPFGRATIVADPTDLLALPALAVAAWQGRAAIARIPPGRLDHAVRAHRAGRPIAAPFADAIRAGADPGAVAALDTAVTAWLAGGHAGAVSDALARLRL